MDGAGELSALALRPGRRDPGRGRRRSRSARSASAFPRSARGWWSSPRRCSRWRRRPRFERSRHQRGQMGLDLLRRAARAVVTHRPVDQRRAGEREQIAQHQQPVGQRSRSSRCRRCRAASERVEVRLHLVAGARVQPAPMAPLTNVVPVNTNAHRSTRRPSVSGPRAPSPSTSRSGQRRRPKRLAKTPYPYESCAPELCQTTTNTPSTLRRDRGPVLVSGRVGVDLEVAALCRTGGVEASCRTLRSRRRHRPRCPTPRRSPRSSSMTTAVSSWKFGV